MSNDSKPAAGSYEALVRALFRLQGSLDQFVYQHEREIKKACSPDVAYGLGILKAQSDDVAAALKAWRDRLPLVIEINAEAPQYGSGQYAVAAYGDGCQMRYVGPAMWVCCCPGRKHAGPGGCGDGRDASYPIAPRELWVGR